MTEEGLRKLFAQLSVEGPAISHSPCLSQLFE